jgi:hypothetical protein
MTFIRKVVYAFAVVYAVLIGFIVLQLAGVVPT